MHAPLIKFWGGPDDGVMFPSVGLADLGTLPEHMMAWRGYRVAAIQCHAEDDTIHAVYYVWREVWAE